MSLLPLMIPAEEYGAITPHDSNNLSKPTRGLYVGVAGDVKVVSLDGNTVTFKALAAGQIHWIRCTRVFATGTTATDVVGVY